jgi:hypothetical protein
MERKKKKPLKINSAKIRDEWGTIKRFCRVNGINYNTYKVVKSGNGTSPRIVRILKKYGYLEA